MSQNFLSKVIRVNDQFIASANNGTGNWFKESSSRKPIKIPKWKTLNYIVKKRISIANKFLLDLNSTVFLNFQLWISAIPYINTILPWLLKIKIKFEFLVSQKLQFQCDVYKLYMCQI